MNAENEYAAYTARVSTIGPSPHGLGVSVRTVQRALKAANDLATDRT